MNYELGRDENATWWEKSIGRGVVQQAGADFLLKCVLYTVSTWDGGRRTESVFCPPSSVHCSHLNQWRQSAVPERRG